MSLSSLSVHENKGLTEEENLTISCTNGFDYISENWVCLENWTR